MFLIIFIIIIIIIKNVKIRVTLSLQGHFTELLKSHRQKRNEVQPENEVSVTPGRWMDTRILNLSAILPYRNSICRPGYEGSKLN